VSARPISKSGGNPPPPSDSKEEVLGVGFFDLSRITEWSSSQDDLRVAGFFQAFYQMSAEYLVPPGARIVKFIGDAGLIVFPKEKAEAVILALCEFATAARAAGRRVELDTYLNISVHVGSMITGSFGAPGEEQFDVIGKTVNIAARLGRRGIILSPQAFRCLGSEARKRFSKQVPPVTYRFRPGKTDGEGN